MRIVQFVERGVKRRGFARTGRAGDQNQSVRRVNGGFELLEGFGVQSELVYARGQIGFVEHAQHDFLAVNGGQHGNAQIEILAADLDAHAAVLRQAAFGDVQAAHDFEARGQRQLHLLGRRRGVHQHAVNAVAQAHAFLERLQVNVAGAVLDGLDDDEIGEFDDRRFSAGGGELVKVDFFDPFLDGFDGVGFSVGFALLLGVLNDVFHRTAALGGINGVQLVNDGFLGRDERGHFEFGDALDVVEGENVQRVGHREEQPVFQP